MSDTDRIPFGEEETIYLDEKGEVPLFIEWESEQCHDCGADRGDLHLPGCDAEQCPECGAQLIGCEHAEFILG